jgi:hypothetical protein
MNTVNKSSRRHFGRLMTALKQARRTRDELAGRALSAFAEVPRR